MSSHSVAVSKVVKPRPRLHQQLYGIEVVEIDHAKNIAFASLLSKTGFRESVRYRGKAASI